MRPTGLVAKLGVNLLFYRKSGLAETGNEVAVLRVLLEKSIARWHFKISEIEPRRDSAANQREIHTRRRLAAKEKAMLDDKLRALSGGEVFAQAVRGVDRRLVDGVDEQRAAVVVVPGLIRGDAMQRGNIPSSEQEVNRGGVRACPIEAIRQCLLSNAFPRAIAFAKKTTLPMRLHLQRINPFLSRRHACKLAQVGSVSMFSCSTQRSLLVYKG